MVATLLAILVEAGFSGFIHSAMAGVSDFHTFLGAMGEDDFLNSLN